MNQHKKIILIISSLLVVLGAVLLVNYVFYQGKKNFVEPDNSQALGKDTFKPLDTTYNIEDVPVNLVNGISEKEIASGSASKIKVSAWGNPIEGDLTGDGVIDAAMIVTYSTGGSGTFYYLVAALHSFESKKTDGTNGILLGDRVAIQNVTIDANRNIIVNYAVRKKDQAMVIPPSINITKYFRVDNLTLKETTPEASIKEQNCSISGGSIKDSMCCKTASDFPDSCLIGACGCSPDNSHQVKTCDCGSNKCFDGKDCVDVQK